MKISRRQFMSLLGASSAAMAIEMTVPAFALPAGATKVIWLEGSGCSGCSVSFLNRISTQAPKTAADVLLDVVELDFHKTLMAATGDTAVNAAEAVYTAGGYLLVVEGGIPTAFSGATCWAWSQNGVDVTIQDVVKRYATRAKGVLCIGNCASWGGVSGAYPNPTGIKSVSTVIGKKTINVGGCPPHPDWIIWTVAQILAGTSMALDDYGRPKALYGIPVHEKCPRRERERDNLAFGVDGYCLEELGCKGPETRANCPVGKWNGGVNWCVDANAPCIGCTEPSFPVSGLMGPGTGD